MKQLKFPKYKYAGDMLCDLEISMDHGHRKFYCLLKDGRVETYIIEDLGEDDILLDEEDEHDYGGFEDSELVSFIAAD